VASSRHVDGSLPVSRNQLPKNQNIRQPHSKGIELEYFITAGNHCEHRTRSVAMNDSE
jgi:hypothetical protein